jgi:hypothetical protein
MDINYKLVMSFYLLRKSEMIAIFADIFSGLFNTIEYPDYEYRTFSRKFSDFKKS